MWNKLYLTNNYLVYHICSGWQKQYENDLYKLLEDSGLTVTPDMKELVLGGEVAMWAEQTDSFSIESKVCFTEQNAQIWVVVY